MSYLTKILLYILIARLIRHDKGLKFIRRPKSSLPDGFKMDSISGTCYFLERSTTYPTDESPLWKKLESPRFLRKRSPPLTGSPSERICKLDSIKSPILSSKAVSKPKATANGGSFLYDDKNGNCIKTPTKEQVSSECFKETSV